MQPSDGPKELETNVCVRNYFETILILWDYERSIWFLIQHQTNKIKIQMSVIRYLNDFDDQISEFFVVNFMNDLANVGVQGNCFRIFCLAME